MNKNNPDDCPATLVAMFISKKWVIQLMRDMISGKKHFKEFLMANEGLTNKILSKRLKEMEFWGIIIKEINNDNFPEYYLTNDGKKLAILIYQLGDFAIKTDLNQSQKKLEHCNNEHKQSGVCPLL